MMPVTPEKACAGNPHARFEEGVSAQEEPKRKTLCDMDEDKKDMMPLAFVVVVMMVISTYVLWDVFDAAPATYTRLHRVIVGGKDIQFRLILIRRALLNSAVLGGMLTQWLRLWRTEAWGSFHATSAKLMLAAWGASIIARELAIFVQEMFHIYWREIGITLGQVVDIVTLVVGMPLLIVLFDMIGTWLFRQKKLRGVFAFMLTRKSRRHSTAKTTV